MLLNGKYHAMARLQKYLVHTGTILILQLLVQYIVQRFGDLNHLLVRLMGEAYLTYNFTKCEFEIYIFKQQIYLKITSTRTNTLSQNNLNLRIKPSLSRLEGMQRDMSGFCLIKYICPINQTCVYHCICYSSMTGSFLCEYLYRFGTIQGQCTYR